MSRVIKFRGRSTSNVDAEGSAPPIKIGDWVYGSLITANGEAFIVNGVVESNWEYIALEEWCPVDPATVGQFTGLRDMNSLDIYENDLVEYIDGEYSFGAVVEWGDYGWYMRGFEPIDNFHFDDIDPVDLKVIGNLHQHPDLLESAS